MADQFNVSFEILHLITILSTRFNSIFARCDLSREKMYALSFINAFGKDYLLLDTKFKIFQRSLLIKIIMEVFECDRTKTNNLVNGIKKEGFVDSCELTSAEKRDLFNDGQNDALYITEKGIKKLTEVVTELKLLLTEILDGNLTLLAPPYASELGSIATGIMLFLQMHSPNQK